VSDKRPERPRLVREDIAFESVEGLPEAWLDDVVSEGTELEVLAHGDGLVVAQGDGNARPAPFLAASLDVVSVVELLTVVVGARHTGVLEVWDPAGRRQLFFERGCYSGAMSSHADDRLGAVLWRLGRISLDQLVIATESLDTGKRMGRLLVEFGYLDPNDLRTWLRRQAEEVVAAACLEPTGEAVFYADRRHPNAVRFSEVATEQMLDDAVAIYQESRKLRRALEPLDAEAHPVVPAPQGVTTEAEDALLQLAMSAKTTLTRREILERVGLGQLHGLRAMNRLLNDGYFRESEQVEETVAPKESRLRRLCEAFNVVMSTLRVAGGGAGAVRDFLADPPEHLADALSGINPDEPVDPEQLEAQAPIAGGGESAMCAGLVILVDFALFEARDTLSEETADRLAQEVADLEVF
jgi:hypothetical protein